jgi:hypothetical protein
MEEEEPPKWACTACSFENYGALNECEMCGTARPAEGWYDANLEGPLTNAQVVEQIRQITECDTEMAVRARRSVAARSLSCCDFHTRLLLCTVGGCDAAHVQAREARERRPPTGPRQLRGRAHPGLREHRDGPP